MRQFERRIVTCYGLWLLAVWTVGLVVFRLTL